jgi:hypothetical protein
MSADSSIYHRTAVSHKSAIITDSWIEPLNSVIIGDIMYLPQLLMQQQ